MLHIPYQKLNLQYYLSADPETVPYTSTVFVFGGTTGFDNWEKTNLLYIAFIKATTILLNVLSHENNIGALQYSSFAQKYKQIDEESGNGGNLIANILSREHKFVRADNDGINLELLGLNDRKNEARAFSDMTLMLSRVVNNRCMVEFTGVYLDYVFKHELNMKHVSKYRFLYRDDKHLNSFVISDDDSLDDDFEIDE